MAADVAYIAAPGGTGRIAYVRRAAAAPPATSSVLFFPGLVSHMQG